MPFPLLDEEGYVLQDELGIKLDEFVVSGEAITHFRVAGTGSIIVEEVTNLPIVDEEGYVAQDERGILLDEFQASGLALCSSRVASTGDILYDETPGPMTMARRTTARQPVAAASRRSPIELVGGSSLSLQAISARGDIKIAEIGTVQPSHNSDIVSLVTRLSARSAGVSVGSDMDVNFALFEGLNPTLSVKVLRSDGSPFDLSFCRVTWQLVDPLRKTTRLKTTDNPNSIAIVSHEGGTLHIYLAPGDSDVPRRTTGDHVYQHKMVIESQGDSFVAMTGTARVLRAGRRVA